ncbi:type II toxin-antitoxin system RelE/ParE family toxin [Caloramator mitchellensis]
MKNNYKYIICDDYLVFYTIDNEFISIQRVLHAKRDYLKLLNEDKSN